MSFACFLIARVASPLSSQMFQVAVGWQIYELTNSAFALGMIGVAQFIPTITLVLFAGSVADRNDRRLVAGACQLLQAVGMCAILVAILLHAVTPFWLFAITVFQGIGRAFEGPAMASILPNLVPRENLARYVSSSTSALKAAQISGPAVGGLLYAASPLGAYAIMTVLLVAAAVALCFTHPRPQAIQRTPVTLHTLLAGVRYVVNDRIILGAVTLDLFAVIMGGATALLPIYARDILHTGAWGLGLLRAAPAVGAISMTLVLARVPMRRRVGPSLFIAVIGFGVATVAFALSHSFVLSVAMLAVSGLFDAVSVVIRQTLVQMETPDDVRGRVTAVNSMFTNSSGSVGQIESGLVAAWLGPVASAVIGGLGTIAVAFAWMFMFSEIAHIDSFNDLHRGNALVEGTRPAQATLPS